VVVGVVDAPPDGVDARPVEGVVHELPETLVDLALWLAEYYGSTPARALSCRAGAAGAAKEQAPAGRAQSLDGEAAPERLSDGAGRVARVVEAIDAGGGHFLLYGATGSGKTEVYLQAAGGGARAGARDDRARPGDRARTADGRPLPGALRRTPSRSCTRA
jgi:primosomal protein N'